MRWRPRAAAPTIRPEPSRRAALPLVLAVLAAACTDDGTRPARTALGPTFSEAPSLASQVRTRAAERGIPAMPAPPAVREDLRKLGQALLFDRELSGNRNISCMTCHHPTLGTGDARSLSIGEGATGLGATRVHPAGVFIPRNAPPLFDLHVLNSLFWDGRVEVVGGTFHTPAGAQLTPAMTSVFEFGAISALPMFPVANREEMRGQPGSNELANIPDADLQGIWAGLMSRLGAIPQYVELFEAAYPGTDFEDMTFAHASNAMGGFLVSAFSFDNSPWDRFLAGNDGALTQEQQNGALKFLNAPCAGCHRGASFSDGRFHNTALAQFGPGQGNGPSGRDDFGRMNVTGLQSDIYRFRTTPLRNVELTAPYGHAGQIADLASFNDHYSLNADKLLAYGSGDIPDPLLQGTLLDNKADVISTRSPFIVPVQFDSVFTREVTAFLRSLTDDRARNLTNRIPNKVPSNLPID